MKTIQKVIMSTAVVGVLMSGAAMAELTATGAFHFGFYKCSEIRIISGM